MADTIVTKAGKLRKKFLPAVYFDTSILIDYWLTDGTEYPETEIDRLIKKNDQTHLAVVRDILKSEIRFNKVVEIRNKLYSEQVKVTAVVSPLCLLEFIEWHAEAVFRQVASEAWGTIFIQKMGKKDIGNYLKKALQLRITEVKQLQGRKRNHHTGLELLWDRILPKRSYGGFQGLERLLEVDIVNFHLPHNELWEEPVTYAYLQLGIADVMHILLAQHLDCQYIASFDTDFARAKEIIQEKAGISVLTSPEEVLAIL